jgi:hypothetical protein
VHLSERDIAALLHGEARHPAFAEHLAICSECAQNFRAARADERTAAEQLAMLDHSVPMVLPHAVMVPREAKRAWPLKQIAAGVTFLFVAFGAATAVPTSPLHKMLLRAVAELRSRGSATAMVKEGSPQREAGRRADTNSGVLFVPDSSLDVVFRQGQPSGAIHVTFVNESLASVSSLGGARSFELGQRQVIANNVAVSGSYAVSIPVTLKRVMIRIGSDTVFTRAGTDIRTVGRMDGQGSFTLPLSSSEWKAMTSYRIH